ncbi:hypothetical protein LINPERPRIM_LOCUS40155 [Linum perenne]
MRKTLQLRDPRRSRRCRESDNRWESEIRRGLDRRCCA